MKRVYYLVILTVLKLKTAVYNCSVFVYFIYNKLKTWKVLHDLRSGEHLIPRRKFLSSQLLNATTILRSSVCVALIWYTSLINYWKGYILSLKRLRSRVNDRLL